MKKAIFILLLTVTCSRIHAQSITMEGVLILSRMEVKATADSLKAKKWNAAKAIKVDNRELGDPNGKYAHFTNCFFLLPEYKKKFRADEGNTGNGVYRSIYSKAGDSILVYYYHVDRKDYPLGLIYKTSRKKLSKIVNYLKHNKYTQTFAHDSVVSYEIRRTADSNVTINKESTTRIEYYIDRCWKYSDHAKKE